MADIDLSSIFRYCGILLTRQLRTNISDKRIDIAGNSFSPIRPSTAAARARMLGAGVRRPRGKVGGFFNRGVNLNTGRTRRTAAKSVPITRLLFTGRFAKGAFQYSAQADHLRVYVSRGNYPVHWTQRPLSYSDIVAYNNQGSPRVNRQIGSPPLIFPNKGRADQVYALTRAAGVDKFLTGPSVNRYINDRIARAAFRKVFVEVKI